MKVFFDTNVYVAELLLGETAELLLGATERARWRIYASPYLLDELQKVLIEKLGYHRRFASQARRRIVRRTTLVRPAASRHTVPLDPADGPILRAALAAAADYLVTNDKQLLALDPYEGLHIISMAGYHQLLTSQGLLT